MSNRHLRIPFALAGFVAISVAIGLVVSLAALPAVLGAGIAAREAGRYYNALPATVEEPPMPARSVMLDANGKPFATFYAYDRTPVEADQIAQVMKDAVIAVEDARFYTHSGFDPVGIARALTANVNSDGGLEGASTITQQYVKNVLALQAELGSENEAATEATDISLTRKLRELRLSIGLTKTRSKEDILTSYLNIAYFGAGAYGVEAAARRYFSTTAANLTAKQAAMLAGLLKNPSGYDPLKNKTRATQRRDVVLTRMVSENVITAKKAKRISGSKLGLNPSRPQTGCDDSTFPHYCEQVMHELRNHEAFGETQQDRQRLLAIGGLRIHTPLRPKLMRETKSAAQSTVPPSHRVATAVALVQPGTGEVVAMASSRNYGSGAPDKTQIVLETAKAFQPGSIFKAVTLAAALDAGMPYSTRLPGGAAHTSRIFNNPPKGYYSNSAGSASNVTLARATQMSMNTAFVQLEEKIGVKTIAAMANKLGITSTSAHGPTAPGDRDGSYTLGTASVSVVDMSNAYATLASGGIACRATFITKLTQRGNSLAVPDPNCHRVMDEAAANSVAHILGTVITEGTGKSAAIDRPAAGKTGTTENLGAAWFAGFTQQYASAVWVGDPRGSAPQYALRNVLGYSSVYGGTLPATVWRKTMLAAHEGLPKKSLPAPDSSYVATSSGELVPNVTGLRLEAAKQRLRVAGVTKFKVTSVVAGNGQAADVVVAQSVPAGTRVGTDQVKLTVTRK